jgi:hypothetical protein
VPICQPPFPAAGPPVSAPSPRGCHVPMPRHSLALRALSGPLAGVPTAVPTAPPRCLSRVVASPHLTCARPDRAAVRIRSRPSLSIWWVLPDLHQHPSGGGVGASIFLNIDGGCSRIFVSTRQRVAVDVFLTLMVGAPGSPPASAKGAHHRRFSSIDGLRFRILGQHLPGGPSSTFLSVDGGRSQILQHHPRGPTIDVLH